MMKKRQIEKLPKAVRAGVLCAFVGVSPGRISQLATEGVIPVPGKTGYPFQISVRAIVDDLRERGNGMPAQLAKEKLRQQTADADTAEMNRDERREKLLPVEWWIAALEEFGAEVKAEVMASDLPMKAKQAIVAKLAKLKPSRIARAHKEPGAGTEE